MTVSAGQALDYNRANSYTKEIYAPKIENMVPQTDSIAKCVPFVTGEKVLGRFYHQPVKLTRSMGVTFATSGGITTMNKGLAPLPLDAQIQGSEIIIRDYMSYGIMARALSGQAGTRAGAKAFVSATGDTVTNLTASASYFREMALLYGGGTGADANLGVVESVTTAAGTVLTVVLTAATFATAIWAGCENGEYDIYSSGGAQRNAAGTAAARDNVYVLGTVAPSTRSLTFASINANVTTVVATDQLFFAGSRVVGMVGIQAACTISGTLWNISTATYALWKPQTVAVGGQLSFESVLAGTAKSADAGFNGNMNLFVSTQGFQDLANDQAALIRYAEKSKGDVEIGFSGITFHSQVGKTMVKPHRLIKNGVAFGLPADGECLRVGSTDITFEMPGFGKMFSELPDETGVQMRAYTDQAFFCKHPGYMVYYTGIVNSR